MVDCIEILLSFERWHLPTISLCAYTYQYIYIQVLYVSVRVYEYVYARMIQFCLYFEKWYVNVRSTFSNEEMISKTISEIHFSMAVFCENTCWCKNWPTERWVIFFINSYKVSKIKNFLLISEMLTCLDWQNALPKDKIKNPFIKGTCFSLFLF